MKMRMRKKRSHRTGIVCTIGPASDAKAVLRSMVRTGMTVARFNFSHGRPEEHARRAAALRSVARAAGARVSLLQDLEGFRIRVGRLSNASGVLLTKGSTVTLVQKDVAGTRSLVSFDYTGDLIRIPLGASVFIDDGMIALAVVRRAKRALVTRVITGGLLKEHKGVNIPGAHLDFNGLTVKDRADIEFGVAHRVDMIAQSFVRTSSDIDDVRACLRGRLPRCRIIAKIENREGIANIDSIIKAADGIMIARGDMGVSVPVWEVPIIQKMIIAKCNRAGKPVITATQMLESMTEHPRPTRAEVADVANAILDGSDFVMLSAETAAGAYPVEAVRMMEHIIKFTERSRWYRERRKR